MVPQRSLLLAYGLAFCSHRLPLVSVGSSRLLSFSNQASWQPAGVHLPRHSVVSASSLSNPPTPDERFAVRESISPPSSAPPPQSASIYPPPAPPCCELRVAPGRFGPLVASRPPPLVSDKSLHPCPGLGRSRRTTQPSRF